MITYDINFVYNGYISDGIDIVSNFEVRFTFLFFSLSPVCPFSDISKLVHIIGLFSRVSFA